MGIIDNLKESVRRLLGIKKKVLIGKVLKDEDISHLDKEVEYERGYKEGMITALEEDVKDLQKSVTPKDLNVAEYLTKQRKSMYYNGFKNSLSMKKMFGFALGKKKGIKVMSYNSKKMFGDFDDILVRQDGRFAIVVSNGNGKKEPVMVGKDIKHIFTNYSGLSNTVPLGILNLNLDEEGRYVENVLEKEIPEIVMDAHGAFHIAEVNREGFMKQLIDKESQISELYNMLSMYEKEIHKLTSNKHLMRIISKFNESRASTAEVELAKAVTGVMEINKNFSDVTKDLALKGYSQHLSEGKIGKLEVMQEAVITKMEEILGKDATDVAREQYIKMANDIIDITQGAKINIIQNPPQQPQQPDGNLSKKFKDIRVEGDK